MASTANRNMPLDGLHQPQPVPASPALTQARAARLGQRESRMGIVCPPVTEPLLGNEVAQDALQAAGSMCQICTIQPKNAALVP